MARTPVHPRWRGEQPYISCKCCPVYGSSPLARGTVEENPSLLTRRRFIPAGAGNSAIETIAAHIAAVHPRWRGEQAINDLLEMKGARFIPAGAGNRNMVRKLSVTAAVHPRWRGEHMLACGLTTMKGGSSPLARGTQADITR